MSKLEHVFVTVIASTPEKIWEALTTAEFTQQYWHETRVESDWTVGARVVFRVGDDDVEGCTGVVLTARPFAELSYTWSFPNNPIVRDEAPSRVSFLLESVTEGTRLTVRHDQFVEGSKMYDLVGGGWPKVLAGLKLLLEAEASREP